MKGAAAVASVCLAPPGDGDEAAAEDTHPLRHAPARLERQHRAGRAVPAAPAARRRWRPCGTRRRPGRGGAHPPLDAGGAAIDGFGPENGSRAAVESVARTRLAHSTRPAGSTRPSLRSRRRVAHSPPRTDGCAGRGAARMPVPASRPHRRRATQTPVAQASAGERRARAVVFRGGGSLSSGPRIPRAGGHV